MEKFDESLGVTSNLQMELCRNGGGSGWTRGMVNSFLMRNGLPVYASGSGYNPDWEKEGVVATVQNRDSRLGIFTKKPGDVNYYGDDGTPSICQISLIFGDAGSLATTGYIVKKGKHYSTHMANDHSAGTSGGIVSVVRKLCLSIWKLHTRRMELLTVRQMDIGERYVHVQK